MDVWSTLQIDSLHLHNIVFLCTVDYNFDSRGSWSCGCIRCYFDMLVASSLPSHAWETPYRNAKFELPPTPTPQKKGGKETHFCLFLIHTLASFFFFSIATNYCSTYAINIVISNVLFVTDIDLGDAQRRRSGDIHWQPWPVPIAGRCPEAFDQHFPPGRHCRALLFMQLKYQGGFL